MNTIYRLSLLLLLVILYASCSSIKNVKYFSNLADTTHRVELEKLNFTEPKIQPDDILSINIQTVDPTSSQVVTTGNMQSSAVGNSNTSGNTGQISGYLVDSKGNIELAVIGSIHVAGLTTEQAKEVIRTQALEYYKKASVSLRFANFKITILGEVSKPGTYVLSNEKVNILDALGQAGDLTIYGKRTNVTLIRSYDDGRRELVHLDLTSSQILNSPYYYLRQNDYIYVEPSKSKVVASDAIQNRNISIITAVAASLVSLLAILISTNKL
ncbi:polysaccharide export outer membrane protein [Mucilaginibacter gracilis]|uniref:Polysaccharide export outer membrane protein n=1 Tax=Mucilaginibacter gracilis TaxID=423350 RepID=A0A495IWV6_9SPHI|nr:polysaccharide biosynthesis/export family protein [Mucilaginibacter gracilis]RKR81082.1 polysaccharide export outer membrane protein [Mucilaginibacter gracilis]